MIYRHTPNPPPPGPGAPPPPPPPEYTFTLGVCAKVDCNSQRNLSPFPDPAGCQTWATEGNEHARILGQLDYTSITDGPIEDSSLVITYENGDPCSTGVNRTVEMTLICDPSHTDSLPLVQYDGEADHCIYRFTLRSNKLGYCPTTYHPSAGGGGHGKSKKGPSGGTIILIIVAVFTFVYFLGGAVYKRVVVGAVGIQMIPNIGFWSSLPGLIAEGIQFTFTCGKSARSQTSYDTI